MTEKHDVVAALVAEGDDVDRLMASLNSLAADFCLLVTRRRHRADLAVVVTGDEADRWLDIAQAYRSSPGPGRQPGQFSQTPSSGVLSGPGGAAP